METRVYRWQPGDGERLQAGVGRAGTPCGCDLVGEPASAHSGASRMEAMAATLKEPIKAPDDSTRTTRGLFLSTGCVGFPTSDATLAGGGDLQRWGICPYKTTTLKGE